MWKGQYQLPGELLLNWGQMTLLPVPDPEGEAASVTGPACPVTPDFRAPPPELGSKDNVLAETTDCPYSSKQGNQGQI
jgi:hypothetical protein